jgi:hypothetical protein
MANLINEFSCSQPINPFGRKRPRSPEMTDSLPSLNASRKTQRAAAERFSEFSEFDLKQDNVSNGSPLDQMSCFSWSQNRPKIVYYAMIDGIPVMQRCGYKSPSEITDSFNQSALNIQQTGSFNFGYRRIPLDTSCDDAGNPRTFSVGAHYLLSKIPLNQPQLISGSDNQSLIIKTFLQQAILSKDPRISVDNGAAKRVLLQYNQFNAAGIPVAKLYNQDEASQGCGYFLFERVPHAFQPTWHKDSTISNNQELATIYCLFNYAAMNQVDIDISCRSLRRRDDGSIVLVNFLGGTPKKGRKLYFELENRIRTFCQQGDPIYNQLHHAISSLNRM